MTENIGEVDRSRRLSKTTKYVAIGAAALSALVLTANKSAQALHESFAKASFTREFVSTDACLHDTPFDPRNGADVVSRELDGQLIVSIIPQAANSYTPSMLNFTASDNFWKPALHFSDHQTGSFLYQAGCEVDQGM